MTQPRAEYFDKRFRVQLFKQVVQTRERVPGLSNWNTMEIHSRVGWAKSRLLRQIAIGR